MDSLTQAVLGASVGYAVGGKEFGRKGLLWGIGLGTLPDLDVLMSFDDPVADFTYHRSFSHSIFVITAISPLLGELIMRVHKLDRSWWKRIYLLAFLVLVTHPLLDAFTSYGTQLLWPLTEYPVYWASISIVDPIFTVPLLIAVIMALVKPKAVRSGRAVLLALAVSYSYLGWTVVAQDRMTRVVKAELDKQSIQSDHLFVTPTLLNNILWYVVAIDGDRVFYGYRSMFDGDDVPLKLIEEPRNAHLLDTLDENWDVQRLKWFTHDLYRVEQRDGLVVMSDLRMGLAPHYVFQFAVGEDTSPVKPLSVARQLREPLPRSAFGWMLDRAQGNTACRSWKIC